MGSDLDALISMENGSPNSLFAFFFNIRRLFIILCTQGKFVCLSALRVDSLIIWDMFPSKDIRALYNKTRQTPSL